MRKDHTLTGNYISELKDYGGEPLIVNIDLMAKLNPFYRTVLWTGENLQVTLMSIKVGGDIGMEVHRDTDQFIRVESGLALVEMGEGPETMNYCAKLNENYAVIVPAGTWHNIINIGNTPLDLYSVYAPPKHGFGTIDETKEIAMTKE